MSIKSRCDVTGESDIIGHFLFLINFKKEIFKKEKGK